MENRFRVRASREEILARLNAADELLGTPKASPDPAEEERKRKIEEEYEKTRFIRSFPSH